MDEYRENEMEKNQEELNPTGQTPPNETETDLPEFESATPEQIHFEQAQPDKTQPDETQPDKTESEKAEPERAEPERVEPEISEPTQGGGYTWQNPSPYNDYTGYTGYTAKPQKPKKERKKLSGTAIALIGVSCVAVVLMLALAGSLSYGLLRYRTQNKPETPNSVIEQDDDDRNDVDIDDLPTIETQQPTVDGALSIPQVYQKMKDSVVGIIVTKTDGMQIGQGSGTGIVISEDGYIATNAHVVSDAKSVKVVMADETEYSASIIGYDERTDLAVIKIDATGLSPAEFGDSGKLAVGETVVAIGNPYGLELAGTVTSGIVSALDRRIAIEGVYMTLIQTDASINPGNSGGPLVNVYGQVIGITSSKIVTTGYEGIGFAIPSSGAIDIIEELIQKGHVSGRPYIGIQGGDLNPTYSQMYNIPQGVYVQYVDPESDAYKKGLRQGDIITALDGVDIDSMAALDDEKNKHNPGDSVTLSVYRNTRKIEITIILSESSGN